MYVLVESDYPLGSVKFFPASKNSFNDTYPHQQYNGPGEADGRFMSRLASLRWRTRARSLCPRRCATLPPVQGSISRREESRSSEASKASTTSSRWKTDKASAGPNRALTVTSLTVI